ncbi:MAG: two-component system regulatory protein YycI [Alkalibacterium sp.]|uniref:two-component system regulatory protein YycI n=1 Tax=Alkalibacterium sp. TaxID=1872447 RepID=UPI003970D44C
MDFKKVENIFLITFLLLNVYLLVSYLNRNDIQQATSSPGQVNLIREMEQIGINIPTLQEEERDVYYVQADSNQSLEDNVDQLENQAGSVAEDGSLYTSILSDPIEIEGNPDDGFTEEDYAKLNAFILDGSVLFGEEYMYLRYDRSQNRFIYAQEVEGIPVADGTSEISLFYGSDGNIISYQQNYAGPMIPQGSTQSVITDRQAIEILFQNNEISSNSTVGRPILTYYRTLHLEDLSMYGPVWYVPVTDTSGEQVLRVDAFERTIISDPVTPVVPEEPEEEEPDEADDEEIDPEEAEEPDESAE